ncbi:MAG TPA: VTT domain-containing protein [Terriglobales bacterium]|nr:VTT domain-containing protein [Terriglobales bacterium]
MKEMLEFVLHYGYALLFLWVLIEQSGLPIPATPLLLAAGALAGQGRMSLAVVVMLTAAGCVGADIFWYHIGKRRGAVVLNMLCRIAMEPDSCVRRTEHTFSKYGARTLLICKFVPGLNTAAPALAGMVSEPYGRFFLFDIIGALLWTVTYTLLGFIFSKQLDRIAQGTHLLGGGLLVLFATGVVAYVLYRWYDRERFLRQVKGDRITPDELKHELEAGMRPVIIDLRHPLDVLTDPRTLPGALQISPEDLETRHTEITRDGDIVLFCT